MKVSKEFKTGVVVVIGIFLLIFGVFFLKGTNLFGENREYYAVYNEIDGLVQSNPVTINGYKVGQVKEIRFLPGSSGRICVTFQIFEESLVIPEDSEARIFSSDLLGSKTVGITLGKSTNSLAIRDTLRSSKEEGIKEAVNAQIAPLKKKTEELIASIDSAVTIVKQILDKDARTNLAESFSGIKRAINTFENTAIRLDTMIAAERAKIANITSNIQSIASNMASNNDRLTNVITNFSNISDSLAAADIKTTINKTKDAMTEVEEIMVKINNGEGTMGMLLTDSTLYENLAETSDDLDALVEDLRVNPHRYMHFSVFGRKPKSDLNLTKHEKEKLKELLK